jgi:hypothetical protein
VFILNELLVKVGLNPDKTLVMRHRPTEKPLRHALRAFALDRPDVFNAYQRCHGDKVEASLSKAEHLVSFIGHEPGRALFVGVYKMNGWEAMSAAEWRKLATSKELMALGDRGPNPQRTLRHFNLDLMPELEPYKGRLAVGWPPPERSWWRRASNNVMPILSISDDSLLVSPLPPWTEIVLTWADLQAMPKTWAGVLSQWRGIYLIIDRASGKSYVGSAYGKENIYARWQMYGATGHGGNVDLKGRDPSQFQYSILQRVSPDMPDDEVIGIESSWKLRLATREFGLNKN